MRVQPEIKMVDVKPETNLTLEMEYMWNFNGIRIFSASNNIVGRILVQDDVRVGGKFKMAQWNRK